MSFVGSVTTGIDLAAFRCKLFLWNTFLTNPMVTVRMQTTAKRSGSLVKHPRQLPERRVDARLRAKQHPLRLSICDYTTSCSVIASIVDREKAILYRPPTAPLAP